MTSRAGRSAARAGAVPAVAPRLRDWTVGVDRGGTWLRILARSRAGDERAARVPVTRALDPGPALGLALRRWRIRPAEVGALVVASRGIWTAAERRVAARRLARLARRVVVIPDVEAAYRGALGDSAGVLLLAGTGSIALARGASGGWHRAGGLGPILGDEGSAFWIGRQWLRATAGEGHRGRLATLLASPDAVGRIAALAPAVLRLARRGDRRARRVVTGAQMELARLVHEAARRARLRAPARVSWAGRLLEDPLFRAGTWRACRRLGLRIAPVPPQESAVAAALRLAEAISR